jgi:hypothetical protein
MAGTVAGLGGWGEDRDRAIPGVTDIAMGSFECANIGAGTTTSDPV